MSVDRRHKNADWAVGDEKTGDIYSWDEVAVTVLMDIRDELQTLNRLLGCRNFTEVPATLRRIANNTAKKRKKK